MRASVRAAALAATVLLANCGGGGTAGAPSSTPNNAATSMTIRINVPPKASASRRRSTYISSATQSVAIEVLSGATSVVQFFANLTPGSPSCQTVASVLQCTATASAPITTTGTYTISVGTYDQAQTAGCQPGGSSPRCLGNELSANAVSSLITAHTSNSVTLALGGIASACTIAPATILLLRTGANNVSTSFTCTDASGATIVGSDPYDNGPITVSVADTLSTATLKLNGGSTARTATVTLPTDTLTVGVAAAPGAEDVTVSATASGVVTNPVVLSNEMVWVLDFRCPGSDNEIFGYPAFATGTVAAEATIDMGPCGGFGAVNGLTHDNLSNLWVSDFNHAFLALVPFGSTTFTTTINGPSTTILHGQDMALDTVASPHVLYLANFGSNVAAFAPPGSGDQAPTAALAPSGAKSVALDGVGHLWVSDDTTNSIFEYQLPLLGGDTPINTINGAATGLTNPGGIAVAGDGTIYVSQNQSGQTVAQFAPGATGNATPARVGTVAGPGVDNVVLDRLGFLWIMDSDPSGAIKRYNPATMPVSGAWSPLSRIAGPGDPVAVGTVY